MQAPYDYLEPSFYLADVYKTVELQSYETLGQTTILVRFVFPPGLTHAHLVPERQVPASWRSLGQVLDSINSYGPNLPVHFVADDPMLCGVVDLIEALVGSNRDMYLLTCGYFPIPQGTRANLTSLYINTKPGLRPRPELLAVADEVRAYWKPGDLDYTNNVLAIRELDIPARKLLLVPYNVDKATIKATFDTAMEIGWRFALHLASAFPDLDSHLQNNPEAEVAFHDRFREALVEEKATGIEHTQKAYEAIPHKVKSK